jgi:Ca-activated chloride channel family protein
MIENIHFLRPAWLLVLPLVAVTWWLIRRRETAPSRPGSMIAPHLAAALTIGSHRAGALRPVDVIAIMLVIGFAGVAGPAWDRQSSPWYSETAPLVIALEVTDSMRSNDVLPTRLDRARIKILDLVGARTGARTALIAYAGSAHIVIPPTTDIDVIKPFLEGLDPAIMPVAGTSPAAVLPLAEDLLGSEPGSLLFVNDGFDDDDVSILGELADQPDAPVLAALVFGTNAGGLALMPDGNPVMGSAGARLDTRVDSKLLDRVASRSGMLVQRASHGDADIGRLLRGLESRLSRMEDPDAVWIDRAWWFVPPAMLLFLFWFRRGFTLCS